MAWQDGPVSTAAILLAAGAGRRYQGSSHKLLAPLRGRRVLDWSLEHVVSATFDETILIIGAVAFHPDVAITVLHNDRWAEGQATSLMLGIDHALAMGHDAVVVGLGDQPFVPAEAWRRVAAATSAIAVAMFEDGRGPNPVRLAAGVWPLLSEAGDEGARQLLGLRSDLVTEVTCPGSAADIDTVEDLDRWNL